jgi:hypothetical protein
LLLLHCQSEVKLSVHQLVKSWSNRVKVILLTTFDQFLTSCCLVVMCCAGGTAPYWEALGDALLLLL